MGREIRKLRKARCKTLVELAVAADRSPSFMSQLERGHTEVSMTLLKKLAIALGVPLGWFFMISSSPAEERGRVVRADHRRRLGTVSDGLVEELLSPDLGGQFEMYSSIFAPGASRASLPRDTEEEGYVISGHVDLWIGKQRFSLHPGDSFRIVREAYRWQNIGDCDAVVLWVIAPPTY